MAGTRDLCTLGDVKEWLGLKTQDADPVLARLITATSAHIESWLSRPIATKTVTEKYSGNGGSAMQLRGYPIQSVSSVTVDGLACTAFHFDEANLVRDDYGVFTRGQANVVVTYTAGYAAIPEEIAQCAVELVALRFKERDRIGLTTQALAQGNTSYAREEFPPHIKSLLQQWRRVSPC